MTLSVLVLWVNACSSESSRPGLSRMPALFTCRSSVESTTCWRRIRPRSPVGSPTTLRARTMFSACVPLIFCTPAVAMTVPSWASMIGLQTLMVMPSRASTMSLKPEKSMTITLVILSPVSSWTAFTVHCGPPTENALVIFHWV